MLVVDYFAIMVYDRSLLTIQPPPPHTSYLPSSGLETSITFEDVCELLEISEDH